MLTDAELLELHGNLTRWLECCTANTWTEVTAPQIATLKKLGVIQDGN